MEYRSQKIAYWYFAAALPLFVLQVILGLWLAAQLHLHHPAVDRGRVPLRHRAAVPHEPPRPVMLLGFMGGTYYNHPRGDEVGALLHQPRLVPADRPAHNGRDGRRGVPLRLDAGSPLLESRWRSTSSSSSARSSSCSNVGMTMFQGEELDGHPGDAARRAGLPRPAVPLSVCPSTEPRHRLVLLVVGDHLWWRAPGSSSPRRSSPSS